MDLKELRRTSLIYKEWRYWSKKAHSIKDKESTAFKRVDAKRLELKAQWMQEKEDVMYGASPKVVKPKPHVEVKPTTFHLHYVWHPSHSLNTHLNPL